MTVKDFIDTFVPRPNRRYFREKCRRILKEDVMEKGNDMYFADELKVNREQIENYCSGTGKVPRIRL